MLDAERRISGIGASVRGSGEDNEAGALGEIGVIVRRVELSPLGCSGGCGLLMPPTDSHRPRRIVCCVAVGDLIMSAASSHISALLANLAALAGAEPRQRSIERCASRMTELTTECRIVLGACCQRFSDVGAAYCGRVEACAID